MPNEVYTDCPACGEEIPFYQTVDEEPRQCPECQTDREVLFDTAMGITTNSTDQTPVSKVATDGGQPDGDRDV